MNKYYVNIKIELKNRYVLYGEDLNKLEIEMREDLETAINDAVKNNLDLKKAFFESKPKVKVEIINDNEYKGYRGKYDNVYIIDKVMRNEKRN